ncbi:hypothetical protein LIER_16627 [Lithospermum erythrorhizon]|uniref:Reverse transcriptase zinc-binding domain-containing protein n=1 Tax=Lithospermum erythrorhizon TaxID=34254 RepID=A0AAV3Q8T7_LITER
MAYAESVTYSVMVNGEQAGGCSRREIQGIKFGPNADPVSYLMFVDDTLLLGRATINEAIQFKRILQQATISGILGMPEVITHGKYLGLPTTIGTSKKEVFSSIVDKVKHKVEDWKSRLLSKASKELNTGGGLQKRKKQYTGQPGPNSVNLSKSKEDGRLGFRDIRLFNLAFLSKQAWKIIWEPDSPLSKALKCKYFPESDFWNPQLGHKPSYTWRRILYVRDFFSKGVEWDIGDGHSINIWQHRCVQHTWSKHPITPIQDSHRDLKVSDLIDAEIGSLKWMLKRSYYYPFRISIEQIDQSGVLIRATQNNLPTPDNLIKRKIQADSQCKLCHSYEENTLHVFNDCKFIKPSSPSKRVQRLTR